MSDHPRGFSAATPGGLAYLDLATVTGWAYGSGADAGPRHGAWSFHEYDQTGRLMADAYDAIADLIEFYRPRMVIVEAPLVTNVRERDGNIRHVVSNDSTISALRGLIEVSRLACFHLGVRTGEFSASTVRQVMKGFPIRWQTSGKSAGKKDWKGTGIAWCEAVGFRPEDHNVADALIGLEYSMRQYEGGGFASDLASRRR